MNPPNLDPTPVNNNNNNSNNNNNPGNQNMGGSTTLPNSVGVLVLGILSIVFCWCYGILAVILGIICLILASQGEKLYTLNPGIYTLASYKNLKAGKTCGIIGLALGTLYLIFVVVVFIIYGTFAFNAFKGFH